jgi:hypothetical protein
MPKKSQQRDETPLNYLSAYTVDDFCKLNRISRSKFYELIQLGKGPHCFFIGIQRRISVESAAQWRKQMEMEATGSSDTSVASPICRTTKFAVLAPANAYRGNRSCATPE